MESLSEVHPLLIDHVLENIFGNSIFSNRDLLVLRGVCLAWNVAATKQYTITFGQASDSAIGEMEKFIKLLQSPESCFSLLNKFDFSADFFPEYDDTEFHTTFSKLLGLIASEVKYLRLEVRESSELIFQADSYQIRTFHCLRTLESEVPRNSVHPKRSDFSFVPHLIGTILENSPVLHNLSISWVSGKFRLNWPHLGDEVLRKIPKSVKRLLIQRVQFGENDFEAFSSLELPNLQYLTLEPWYTSFDLRGDHVYDLFANSKNETLLQLDFAICPEDYMPGFKLPVFPNVRTLKLGNITGTEPIPVGVDISLLKIFPKITELDVTGAIRPKVLLALLPVGLYISQVNSCRLRLDKYFYFDGFTNLTKLVIQIPINLRRGLFGYRNGLEHLELEFEEGIGSRVEVEFPNLDSILTGISAETCESFRTNPVWREIPLETIKIEPGISDFTNLKTLSIKSQIPVNITDVTAQFGFLILPCLQNLIVEEFSMSHACIQNLKLIFGEGVIRRQKSRRCNLHTIKEH